MDGGLDLIDKTPTSHRYNRTSEHPHKSHQIRKFTLQIDKVTLCTLKTKKKLNLILKKKVANNDKMRT